MRRGKWTGHAFGYIVTWDVDSSNRAATERLRRFVYGEVVHVGGRWYRYPGFVEKEGVRYLGQSVLFVPSHLLATLDSRLTQLGIDHEAIAAALG